MRKLLMAGSALMLMGGIAFAQTPAGNQAPTAGMNNTGVTGQMPGSTSGNMSPGGNSSGMMKSATPSGDQTMPMQRQTTAGKTRYHSSMMRHHPGYISHHMGGMMPTDASAGTYLRLAQQAVMSHNKMRAHDALGRAETDLLTNSYVQGSVNGPISTPAISDIRDARKAVDGGDYSQASMLIHKAMADMHGGKSGTMMDQSGMSGSPGQGVPGAMSHSSMGNTGMNKP
ncbi:MAG: hypothetical protein PHT60_02805 [Acidiphilium sp.]|nr:hypothetical protein [Acidiphilium sp.]MDD4934685.1 hypothetical protein [Acidiphilium sp.]